MTSPSRTRRRFDPAPLYKALFLTLMAAFVAVPLIATVLLSLAVYALGDAVERRFSSWKPQPPEGH